MNKKLLVIAPIGAVVVIGIVLVATGALKLNVSVSPSQQPAQQEFVVPEGWQKYTSGEFGYTIAYPSVWNLTEENTGGKREVLVVAPEGLAFARVAAFRDSSITSQETIEASIAEYKSSLESQTEDHQVKQFESRMDGNVGVFGVSGLMLVNDIQYQFLEKGVLAQDGRVLIMRGAAENRMGTQEEFEARSSIVRDILDSFKPQ